MRSKTLIFILFLILLIPIVYSDSTYKPYLHKPSVPEHPEIVFYGQYKTSLFPGAATYSLPINVPKGTNNLQPSISLFYNSQAVQQRPGIIGAGWSITQNYIYRDINFTAEDTSDDLFKMVLDGIPYELVMGKEELYHTRVEYNFKIENLSGGSNEFDTYWLVTKRDGTKYRFGYNTNSELVSNTFKSYVVKWSLDKKTDTHGNEITYSYLENPNPEDSGTCYLYSIEYTQREIKLDYESSSRPDRRLVFDQGNKLDESRRLSEISVFAEDSLVRRYDFDYVVLSPAITSLSKINQYGSDNVSLLYNITFDYYNSKQGFKDNGNDWKPPAFFSNLTNTDFGVRQADINNDGFIDLVQGRPIGSIKKVWINDKVSNWTESNWTENSSWILPEYVTDDHDNDAGFRFADVDRDGYADIIKSEVANRKVYLNNKTNWINSTWVFPNEILNDEGLSLGLLLSDVNRDGRADIIESNYENKTVHFNNGSGWVNSSWTFPLDLVGTRVVDLNGDGLPDVIKGTADYKESWINNGSGWFNHSAWAPPVSLTNGEYPDNGVRFVDVNKDGLLDFLRSMVNSSVTYKQAWINNGSGWISNDTWNCPQLFVKDNKNVARRLADINGDGFADILTASQDTSVKESWNKNKTIPYLLKTVTNEYGGKININYTESTQFDNTVNGTSAIGFNIFVVKNITTNNSMNSSFSVVSLTSYNYSKGRYNYDDFEFRGFGYVKETKPYSILDHYFYQGDARKGKEYKTETYDSDDVLYSKTLKEFYVVEDGPVYNISLLSSADYLYDGYADAKITNKSFEYDFYGNMLYMYDYGDISVSGDEKYFNYSYAYNTEDWIMNRQARSRVYDSSDNKVKDTKYYYDDLGLKGIDSTGELTKIEEWNNEGNDTHTYFFYDDYGNVITKTDSYGNSVKYVYDETNTYLASVMNALGHVVNYDYYLGTGNLLWEEQNAVKTEYVYDTFGRVIKEIKPYDSSLMPTKEYSYGFDGIAPEEVNLSLKTTSGDMQDISYYYDGFSNLVQLKTSTDSDYIVKNIFYDDSFRVSSEQNPYFDSSSGLSSESSTANKTYYTYDALDRVVKVVNPDSSVKNVSFEKWNITDYDENGNKHKYELDAYGRIVQVYEYNTNDVGSGESYNTTYAYDVNDNLILITDSLGNTFSFSYDSLNRKISMDDPDLGEWSYYYDQNSNLIKQIDSRNKTISLAYDSLNRIENKTSDDVNITFSYDAGYDGVLTDISMGNITINYSYDDRLRVIKEIKTIDNIDFDIYFIYDSQDRIISEQGFSDIDYKFDTQGKVQEIIGFISDSSYNSFGSILNRTYANNLISYFTYDSENNRLEKIYIPNVQNMSYTYDSVGNIVSITDTVQNKNHILRYDDLDRLINATIGSDVYKYSYNPVGNIMKIVENSESKKFVYSGNKTHAPSQIISGSSGIDVYNPSSVNTVSKNRRFEFYLVSDDNAVLNNVNLTVDFGDGNTYTNNSISINGSLLINITNNYAHGRNYTVNISAQSSGINDEEFLRIQFGARAAALENFYSNISKKMFEFEANNDVGEMVYNVSWNCSDGISSVYSSNLSGNQSLYSYILHNYTYSGDKTFTCSINSSDGVESKSISFTIKGSEIEDYDILTKNISKRIISFNVKNYFSPVSVNISVDADSDEFSKFADLSSNEEIMVLAEVEHSTDGMEAFDISLSSTNDSYEYVDSFKTTGASIENYKLVNTGVHSNKIILFDIRNNWHSGVVNWTIDEPSLSNSSTLANDEMVHVMIAHNYTTQGDKEPIITAIVSSYVEEIFNFFKIKPLKIKSYETLSEGVTTVSELNVINNLETSQQFDWKLDTGIENISSGSLSNVSDDIFVYIESNYSIEGVYRTRAIVNSSSYDDNTTGVVVV